MEKGYKPEQSTVTTIGIEGMTNISEMFSKSAESILKMIANSMTAAGSHNVEQARPDEGFLLMGAERAQRVGEEMSKQQVKEFLCRHAVVPVANLCQELQEHIARIGRAKDGIIPAFTSPDRINIVVAGGIGHQSLYLAPVRRSATAVIQ